MELDLTPYLMGDPVASSRRPPTDDERARLERHHHMSGRDLWSEREEALLRKLHARDWTYEAIAQALNRTRNEIGSKAKRLGLPSRDPRLVGFKGWRRRRVA